MRKIKIASLFTGVAGAELGFEAAFGEENVEHVAFAEYDKFASQVLAHRYPDVPNFGDVTKIDWEAFPKCDLLHSSSPCTSFSVAGKRKGMEDEKTGSVLWDAYWKCLETVKAPIVTFENVPGLLSSGKGEDWKNILSGFESRGYHVKWSKLNALDFHTPQNRVRVILVGFLDKEKCDAFEWPTPQPRTKKLKDILQPEDEVDVKYYLKPEAIIKLLAKMTNEQVDRLLSLPAVNVPLKFVDRNGKQVNEYAGTVDTAQTNGVGVIKTMKCSLRDGIKEVETSGTIDTCYRKGLPALGQMREGVAVITDHDSDKVGIAINRGQIVTPMDGEFALCQTASQYKGLDNRAARTGVAIISQPHGNFVGSVESEHIGALREATPDNQRVAVVMDTSEEIGMKADVPAELRRQGTLTEREVSPTLRAESKSGDDEVRIVTINPNVHQDYRVYSPEGASPALAANRGGGSAAHPMIPSAINPGDNQSNRIYDTNHPCATLSAGESGGGRKAPYVVCRSSDGKPYVIIGDRALAIRRLTCVETCRLMSWPDDWNATGKEWKKKQGSICETNLSNSARYKQCGNGIVSHVVAAVAESIKPLLESSMDKPKPQTAMPTKITAAPGYVLVKRIKRTLSEEESLNAAMGMDVPSQRIVRGEVLDYREQNKDHVGSILVLAGDVIHYYASSADTLSSGKEEIEVVSESSVVAIEEAQP
jgi:DNA-cytosine methyltransferase